MLKLVCFLKRRYGLSRQEFMDYYEHHHSKLGEQSLRAMGATRYVRRYLDPLSDRITGQTRDSGFDVITEVWFADRAAFERGFRSGVNAEWAALIAEDEARLFDRDAISFALVEEHDSDMTQPSREAADE